MKKKVISAMLAAAMIISVTGCGNNGGTESAKDTTASGTETAVSDTKKDGAATIEFWTNNRHDEAYMNEMIDSFNASHSDIQINYTILTDDWANSIQLAYQGGTAPDIISIQASDNMTLQTYVDAGIFYNIKDYIAGDEEFQKVTEAYDHKYEGLTSFGDDIYWVPNGVRTGTRIEWNKDLVNAAGTLQGIIEELDTGMRRQFTEKFQEIRVEFDKVFKQLFGGGKGTLELTEEEDVLEAGIRIISQPPGKKLQNMMQLSGGEKALTAIALLFAIQNLKPSPFCLLDEIEAALDDSNVGRFAGYLQKLTKNTQFIIITHRRGTMNAADRLYGITMQEKGVSTLVSVDLVENQLTQ